MQKYMIGTMFEQQEQNKKMNITTMKAKDPNGNVRWKGAFTGGFQAGYKNTCGTKDGWMPSQFISSVLRRAEKKQQNVLDYMDRQDLGRQNIANNIGVNDNFSKYQTNPLNISLKQSIGQKILNKFKKKQAEINAPENIEDLNKLLTMYAQEEQFTNRNNNTQGLKDLEQPYSIGAIIGQIQDDQFIESYQNLYHKIVRGLNKEETEEQKKKKKEDNKIYFDFNKPLEQEPEYLKQIQQIEELSVPKKRRKNVINSKNLKQIFKVTNNSQQFNLILEIPIIPEQYNPYWRIHELKNSEQKTFIQNQIKQVDDKKHRIYNIKQRSDILGYEKLSNKFRSSSNEFMKITDNRIEELKKIFTNEAKNKRYHDYVEQIQGKRILAQQTILPWQEAMKEKNQFEKMYQINKLKELDAKKIKMPKEVQNALNQKLINNGKKQIQRNIYSWKPEKLLCKRFAVLIPFMKN